MGTLTFNLVVETSEDGGASFAPHSFVPGLSRGQVERALRSRDVPGRAIMRMLSGSGGRWPVGSPPPAGQGRRYLRVELVEPEVRRGA